MNLKYCTDANRRQTERNEACFDCRGANRWSSEEEPSSLELSRVATEEGKANEEKPEGLNDTRLYEALLHRLLDTLNDVFHVRIRDIRTGREAHTYFKHNF